MLLRSVLLTSIMASPVLLRPCLYLMGKMTTSKSIFLDAEKNPLLGSLLKHSVYRQFCAGSNAVEVKRTVAMMKEMGYRGMILGYAKEFMASTPEYRGP